MYSTYVNSQNRWPDDVPTLNRTVCFSPARTFRETSSSDKCKHLLSYDALEPERASFSLTSDRVSGEQKQRYAWFD